MSGVDFDDDVVGEAADCREDSYAGSRDDFAVVGE